MKQAFAIFALSALCSGAMAEDTPTTPKLEQGYGDCERYLPQAALVAHATGETRLSFRVVSDGSVRDVVVTGSAGRDDLDQAALACVAAWRYQLSEKDVRTPDFTWKGSASWNWYSPRPHGCYRWRKTDPTGIATLKFTITTEGRVEDAIIVRSSGNEKVDSAALDCVSYWRYHPAVDHNKPVAVPWVVDIQWGVTATPVVMSGIEDCKASIAREKSATGRTQVSILLVGGIIFDTKVAQSSGNEVLDRAAMACVSRQVYRETATAPFQGYRETVTIEWNSAVPNETQPAPSATAM